MSTKRSEQKSSTRSSCTTADSPAFPIETLVPWSRMRLLLSTTCVRAFSDRPLAEDPLALLSVLVDDASMVNRPYPYPGDRYDRTAAAARDRDDLLRSLKQVTDPLATLTEEFPATHEGVEREQRAFAQQIISDIDQLAATARELVAQGADQEPGLAFSSIAQATAIKTKLKHASKQFSGKTIWNAAKTALKNAVPKLWSLISHLVKVKEWSVTGQVGTGVFGFAQASVSVTFGK